MTPEEIDFYAVQLAALTVTAARATSCEQLSEIHEALAETYSDVLALLSHDAEKSRDLLSDLNAAMWGDWDGVAPARARDPRVSSTNGSGRTA